MVQLLFSPSGRAPEDGSRRAGGVSWRRHEGGGPRRKQRSPQRLRHGLCLGPGRSRRPGRGPHLCQRLGYAMPMTPGLRPRPTDAWPRPGPRPGRVSAWAWASAWAGVLGCAHGSLLNNYRTTTEQPIEQLGEQLIFSSCFARNGGFQEVPKGLPPLQRT